MKATAARAPARRGRKGTGSTKRAVLMVYAVWVAVVLLASVPYMAESATRMAMGDGEYEYHPTFTHDGTVEHYEVERADTSMNASLDIFYDDNDATVDIRAVNIMTLTVNCRSIAVKHQPELMNSEYDTDEMFQQFFHDLGKLTVNTEVQDSDGIEVTFEHMPIPTAVVADGDEYEGTWSTDPRDDIVVDVPDGSHEYILYFGRGPEFPVANISVDHPRTLVDSPVTFDGSGSRGGTGAKGAIIDYLWDFDADDADLKVVSGSVQEYAFEQTGTYTVSLTVRNGYYLKDTATVEIEVVERDPSIDLDGDGVPDWFDEDIDGDGVVNKNDEFPLDPDESADFDGDGIGDNEDTDDDNDGVPDDVDADPYDPNVGEMETDDPQEGGDDEDAGMFGMGPTMDIVLVLVIVVVVVMVILMALMVSRSRKKKEAEEKAAQEAAAARAAQAAQAAQAAAAAEATAAAQYGGYEGYDETAAQEAYDAGGTVEEAGYETGEFAVEDGGAEGLGAAFGAEASPGGEAPAEGGAPSREEYVQEVDRMAASEFGFSDDELAALHEAFDESLFEETGVADVSDAAEAAGEKVAE